MANQLTMQRLLGFKDFFPNEEPHSKEYYALKLGRDVIEKTTPFFLSYFRGKGAPEIDDLLKEWFTFYDHKYFQSPSYVMIEGEYRRIKNHHPDEKHSLISVESLLNMFLWTQSSNKIPDSIESQGVEAMLPFLEFVLLFNDDVLANYEKARNSIKSYGENRKIQRLILAGSFSQSDLVNIDYAQLLYTQVYKLAKLLTFLETTQRYRPLLAKLLMEFACQSKEEYLKAICAAAVLPLKSPVPSWNVLTLKNADDKIKGRHILDQLALSEGEVSHIDQDDYLSLRNKPFQKLSEEDYRVIFELFLIKKTYNGLIFKLSSYDKDFLGNIRIDFSEGVLVYETLRAILSSSSSVLLTGDELKASGLDREPDFYCRNGNNILLFESKDFYMKGEYKLSYDFSIIERELKKDGRLKKAVTQIVRNIERCLLNEISLDTNYNAKEVNIYPVIIVHDSLYSAPALNYWVYYWFIDELEILKKKSQFKNSDFSKILPISVIEIDTLLLYETQFQDESFDLIDLIKNYHLFVRFDGEGTIPPEHIEEHALQSALSFSEFVRNTAHRSHMEISFDRIRQLLQAFGVE